METPESIHPSRNPKLLVSIGHDQSIPKVWDFSKDVLILVSPRSTHLLETANKRGQKYIIAYFEADEVVDDYFTQKQSQTLYIKFEIAFG